MTMLEEGVILRDKYLEEHGLDIGDFGLNYQFPPVPRTNWDWYKTFKFGTNKIFKRFGFFLIYLNPEGEPYLQNDVPYGIIRFLGAPTGVPKDEEDPPKAVAQWGRRSEIHFEPLRNGRAWENLTEGSTVIHCESLIKAKCVHKYTGLPCIGYNGVYGYQSNKQGIEFIHKYCGFDFAKMNNVILFDSDVRTNPLVVAARENLMHKLRHVLNCSMVGCVDLPQPNHSSDDYIKDHRINWGPDDYIVSRGADALLEVLKEVTPYQDEEFSELISEVNQKIRWVRDQDAVFDRDGRRLKSWQAATLSLRNINRIVANGKGIKRTVYGTEVWLQSKHREEVDSVGYRYLDGEFFTRGDDRVANEYLKDGSDPGTEGFRDDDIIWQMIQRLFVEADRELLRSYLRFLKYTGDKPTSYCILWSTVRGVGKGWFTEFAIALLGRRHVSPATADSLAEKYNLHTINTRLVVAHEFHASSKANRIAALDYLKNYIGDETIMVRAMHRNPYKAETRAGLIITVNDKTDMPSDGLGDRRQWYIQAGATGAELWPPEDERWNRVYEALKDKDQMARAAKWVEGANWIDFKSWRPPVTEERMEDLIEGQIGPVQEAFEVLKYLKDLGVRVVDGKTIRALIIERMEGQELFINGRAFGKYLKDAGWWTHEKYARAVQPSRTAAWFTEPMKELPQVDTITKMLKEDVSKIVKGKF